MDGNGTRSSRLSPTSVDSRRDSTPSLRSVAFLPPGGRGPAAGNPAPAPEASSHVLQGVAVLTATVDGIPHGLTIGSVSIVSFHPTVVTLAVRRAGSMHQVLSRNSGFGLSLLAGHQEFTARFFASRNRPTGVDQFDRVPFRPGPVSGSPLLSDALGWLDCTTAQLVPIGPQVLVVGNVGYDVAATPTSDEIGTVSRGPLLRGGGRYHRARDPIANRARRTLGHVRPVVTADLRPAGGGLRVLNPRSSDR